MSIKQVSAVDIKAEQLDAVPATNPFLLHLSPLEDNKTVINYCCCNFIGFRSLPSHHDTHDPKNLSRRNSVSSH
jgi:hypothetical protein